jgi:hypothetical protein
LVRGRPARLADAPLGEQAVEEEQQRLVGRRLVAEFGVGRVERAAVVADLEPAGVLPGLGVAVAVVVGVVLVGVAVAVVVGVVLVGVAVRPRRRALRCRTGGTTPALRSPGASAAPAALHAPLRNVR